MHVDTTQGATNFEARRLTTYVLTVALLLAGAGFLRRSPFLGTAQMHTTIEVVASLLAMLIGILGLVRFYSQKENIFLFIGTGFIGTSFLDGYHAFVSSSAFTQYFPSPPPSLIPWSGLASRIFLSVLFWLSWVFWRRESRMGRSALVPEYRVYFVVNTWTFACFLIFAVLPLPLAYLPVPVFHRPQQFIAVAFCVLSLTGYLLKGHWKHDSFEHWLILSIILFTVHSIYLALSARLYDAPYIAAHLLRLCSYGYTLAGLIIAMRQLSRHQDPHRAPAAGTAAKDAPHAARTSQSSPSTPIYHPGGTR